MFKYWIAWQLGASKVKMRELNERTKELIGNKSYDFNVVFGMDYGLNAVGKRRMLNVG